MKSKKMNKTITLLLFSVLLLPLVLTNNNATAATLTPGEQLITDMKVVIKGYDGVDQSSVSSTSFSDTVYNHTIPIVNLQADSFAAADIAPTDFKTDGITRTYSDSIYQSLSTSTSTARGMFSVLQYIKENEFPHFTIPHDITAYTYTPVDSFYTTVNDSMYAENVLWTAENFTVSEMYTLVTCNREYVDLFFADVIASDGYQMLIDTQSTNQELIVSVLDSAFAKHCFDIIYSPVNETNSVYSATWTIAEEVQAVLGGNATDTSVNNTMSNTSVRDAIFGFLGQKVVPDATIGAALSAYVPDGVFSAFKATPTTYSFQWNIRSDYAGSPLHKDLKFLLTVLTEAEYEALISALNIFWLEACIFGLIGLLVLGIITKFATKGKKNSTVISIIAGLVGFILVFMIYIFATMSSIG